MALTIKNRKTKILSNDDETLEKKSMINTFMFIKITYTTSFEGFPFVSSTNILYLTLAWIQLKVLLLQEQEY
jgi:hypothetical protein